MYNTNNGVNAAEVLEVAKPIGAVAGDGYYLIFSDGTIKKEYRVLKDINGVVKHVTIYDYVAEEDVPTPLLNIIKDKYKKKR